jgi:hypothetical protein
MAVEFESTSTVSAVDVAFVLHSSHHHHCIALLIASKYKVLALLSAPPLS